MEYIYFIVIAIVILATSIPLLLAAKKKGFFEAYAIVESMVRQYMEEVENMEDLTGKQKRDYVVEKIKEYMAQQKISLPVEEILVIIERLIYFSKKVNK